MQKKEKGKWVDKEILDLDRDYTLFNILAGVRGDSYKPISYPKGLPEGFEMTNRKEAMCTYHPTHLTKDEDWDPGVFWMGEHSYSHLTLQEINKYNWNKVYLKDDYWPQREFTDLFIRCKNLKNWRIVMGFDS